MALKKLYLKVHPDLFENHPEQKDTNARSLALLTSLLDSVRNGQNLSSHSIPLKFYMYEIDAPASPQANIAASYSESPNKSKEPAGSSAATHKFKQISITFRLPPEVSSARFRSDLVRQLQQLLCAAGLPKQFEWDGDTFASPTRSIHSAFIAEMR